jgi:hypothetical protein
MNMKLIEGKVAKILNSRQLAINKGEKDSVEIGMIFDVLDPIGENIPDPDTGEILGSIRRPKVRVKIIEVQECLSLATTFLEQTVNIGGAGFDPTRIFSQALSPARYVKKVETLKTTEDTWENLKESESYVKTGDPVRQVVNSD